MTAPTLDRILSDFEIAASIVGELGPIANVALPGAGVAVTAGSALAGRLLVSIQAGVRAHEAITGQPLDMGKLHEV